LFTDKLAIATDYDGTIANLGAIDSPTLAALARFRASGRKLILDTGRELHDLLTVCPDLTIFDLVLVENGAVLYDPTTREERPLADPPPQSLLDAFKRREIPVLVGRVVLETYATYHEAVQEALAETRVAREITFNNTAIIILPPGVHKGSGLVVALEQFGISLEQTAGIGDAENDHDLLAVCGLAVAVPNAIDALKKRAHVVLSPIELIDKILTPSSSTPNEEPASDPHA
jgi:hydroxymethylpyrimidine pyrophosphatase-like HAD family hydrolase